MPDFLIINGTSRLPELPLAAAGEAGIGVDVALELRVIEAESIGWRPLGDDAYLHAAEGMGAAVISVVGLPQDAQQGVPTLLLV